MLTGKIANDLRERVIELFHVDLESGRLTRKHSRGGRRPGEVAGTLRPDGYRSISIDNKSYLEHSLLMLVALGYMPEQVDHINGDKSDNRSANLRPVSQYVNSRNQRMSSANKTGETGVRYRSSREAYEAYWVDLSGKKRFRYFKCSAYESPSGALAAAAAFRAEMIAIQNRCGDAYTDRHGKERAA
ncbi:HNH endonuclease [Stutzerimonas stutzeri]|uniref:HNH endonuclease n=1 Tax=Stutzerimonas stutzeri TaxID=316 RepID=UPI003EE1F400